MKEVRDFINIILKGFSQIMLQNNVLTGVLFLGAILYDSALMAFAGVVANVVAVLTAKLLKYNADDIKNGLYGFNASLLGIALVFYFQSNIWVWVALIVGSALSTIVMGIALKKKIPVYTFPFVLLTWIALFVLSIPELALRTVPSHFVDIVELEDFLIEGHAFGQVIFQGSFIAGVIFFIGVFLSEPIAALYAFFAVVLSTFISHQGNESTDMINEGLFSFNAVLCGIAMSGPKVKNGIYVVVSVIIATYFDRYMIHTGWTTLTFPFVFAMWIMYLIKKADEWIVAKYCPAVNKIE